MNKEKNRGLDDYLVMNWADDVNYMFTDVKDAEETVGALINIAEELKLPFSKDKCKLVPLYPHKHPKKLKEKYGTEIKNLVTVAKEARILGVTWSQPRYRQGEPYMFQ